MNNTYAMSASFEARKNSRATMITAGFAGLMVLLMFLLKWSLPVIEVPIADAGIEINLKIEDEVPAKVVGGGGGGGNPVQAAGHAGLADPTPPQPGVKDESKDIETDENDKAAPPVVKPINPKPVKKVVENTSVVKATPKAVIETPVPPRKAKTLYHGSTTTGTSTGGNEAAATYTRKGGSGNGNGVGDGDGNDGGRGNGNGGGNGPGSGTGNGPRKISGNRVVINPKNMDAGENLKGKVFAEINVSPDGIGSFVKTARGSTVTSGQAIEIIREWLRRNHFNKSNEESTVVYEFNFIMGG
jgi:hypothetical protein